MFDWEKAIVLHALQGIRASSRGEGLSLVGFLELRQAPGVYSRVTTGMPILNESCLVKSGHFSMYDGHLGKLN